VESDQTNNIFLAEKMFFKAEKIKQDMLNNLEVASPEDYVNVESAHRKIIERFNKYHAEKGINSILRRSWLTIAELSLLQKNFDSAINIYQQIIEKSPHDRELSAAAQFSIARCYEQTNNLDEAIKCYEIVFKRYPPVLSDTLLPNYSIIQTPIYIARLYRQKGMNALADQQYNEARNYYDNVTKKWPKSEIAFVAQNQIAITYGDQEIWEKSVEILNQVIRNYPNNKELPAIMYTLGQVYQQQLSQPYKAFEYYKKIIQAYPQDGNLGKVHLAMGSIYFAQKNFTQARDEYSKVIANYSKDVNSCISAQFAIAKSFELEKNWNKALNEYQWIINNYPSSMQALQIPLYLADHYTKNQEHNLAKNAYENGIKQYEQVIEKYPNTLLAAVALDNSALIYSKLERWNKAAEMLESLLEAKLPPQKQVETYLKLEYLYEDKLNDMEKALQTYAELVQKYPELPNAASIKTKAQQLQQNLKLYKQTNKAPSVPGIISANILSTSSVEVLWNQNNENDFDRYKLIRSEIPGIEVNGNVVTEIPTCQHSHFVDNDVKENRTYYYRVFTFDKGGLHTGSREISIKVEAKQIVATVNLQAKSINWSIASLRWNRYNGRDFDCYKIYRSSKPGVNSSSDLVQSIFNQQDTQFEDANLKENTTYHYRIFVYNTDGANKPSNEINITTLKNAPPKSIRLNNPLTINRTSIELSWTSSDESDFSMYRIYRSDKLPMPVKSTPIWMNSNKRQNKYKDTGLTSGKTYYYKIVVYDKGGLLSESNEVSVTL